ncbi:MAG: 4Fe-4S binding protein [Acidaminococcales bacterium]|jgi:2-oxoglutarate ferredoxin oxidoreductase subunit delta|nr:4Fe-4S binding protein [Acidaminococcales bacterium]
MGLKIIEARCKGCGICVAFCPKQVLGISEIEKVQIVNGAACIACRQCETRCPDFAIFVAEPALKP